ncbi:hypothetical protein LCM19_12120 [Qipengyuania flava]|nr:hypothetical protein [Qipengyuania flava]
MSHAADFIAFGPRPYHWAPAGFEIFWSSLIGLDAVAVALFLARRIRPALLFSAAIMLADVVLNYCCLTILEISQFAVSVPLQALFLGFVLGSLPFLWPDSAARIDEAGRQG